MGTPEIAAVSLKRLLTEKLNIVAVVTTPDKPAGRGLQIKESPVKKIAIENHITVFQPVNLGDAEFINTLKELDPDIFIVVAFRKIPDELLNIPKTGAFNLHASLLPQYRGAAPINWAIINGENETGLTTFFLTNKIDCGDIILQKKIEISERMIASELYDIMKVNGAELVMSTLKLIFDGSYTTVTQQKLNIGVNELKKAPKIYKENCRINWSSSCKQIFNHIRGLAYLPGAYSELLSPEGKIFVFKIYHSEYTVCTHNFEVGHLETDNSQYIKVYAADGYIDIKELQLSGKKILCTDMLLRGFKLNNSWKIR